MQWLAEVWRRLIFFLGRGRFDRDLDEEMRHHLELKARAHIHDGLAPGEARYAALREFGNTLLLREEGRRMWGWDWAETLLQDLRYSLRQLRRSPGFTAVAVVTVALGIGANTLIFSVVNAAILHPLPFRDASGIMTLWVSDTAEGYSGPGTICDPDYPEWRNENPSLGQVAGFRGETANLTGAGEPVRLIGAEASASLFPLLGVSPVVGRGFSPQEEQPDRNRVVLLSNALWRSRFASDPAVVGKPVKLDGNFFTVVGVMPVGFDFPNQSDFWTPVNLAGNCHNASLQLVARLKPGMTLSRARSDAALIMRRQQVDQNDHRRFTLVRLVDEVAPDIRSSLLVLLGAVGLVLLIACANVANLLLARAATRQREIAVRTALGAGRMRIVRQMLTESAMMATLGGALGLILAEAGHSALASAAFLLPRSLVSPSVTARIVAAGIDPWVLGFTLAVALLTGILFGLAPALQASRPDLNDTLKEGGRGLAAGAARGRFRDALAAAEIALALVLLAGSGLLIRSFLNLTKVDPGFRPQGVLTLNVSLPEFGYSTPAGMVAFESQAVARLASVPGVRSAGAVSGLPLGDMMIMGDYTVEGQAAPQPGAPSALKAVVGGDYFRAMGIPLVRGRFFSERDSEGSQHVVIVNESFARRYWPHQDAVGNRLKPGFSPDSWCTIVGVVGDVRQFALAETSPPAAIYLPYAQSPIAFLMRDITFVVRGESDALSVAPAARRAMQAVDPDLPVFDVASMEQLVNRSVAGPRFSTLMLASFAALALLLAAVGIYGVIAYSVTQRTHEIGVRMALGARGRDVVRQILGQGMVLAGVGIAAGLLAALALTRFLSGMLYGVRAADPFTFVAVSVTLAAIAMVATYVPARRATKVDPIIALRCE
ncbi:MAG TPA: ABC transporter permease [Terriglobia bacterium]|nr:ABC transporter permease [Terriglobia bacterium]